MCFNSEFGKILLRFGILRNIQSPVPYQSHTEMIHVHEICSLQQTVQAILHCMIDAIGQSGQVEVYYNVLEMDESGRPPDHRDFVPTAKSSLHVIAKGGYTVKFSLLFGVATVNASHG